MRQKNNNIKAELCCSANIEQPIHSRSTESPEDRIKDLLKIIEEYRQTEKTLSRSEVSFRELVEMLPEIVFETDIDINLTYANQQLFNCTGYSNEDIQKGLYGFDLFALEDRTRAIEDLALRLRDNNYKVMEYKALRKDGSIFPMLLHISPIIKEGKHNGFRGVVIDITERQSAEKELLIYQGHLEDLVNERTKELEKAKEKAEIASKSKSEFLANISHELRTPLNAVIGFSELLSSMMLDNKQKSYVQSIKVAGRNLLLLINDILDLSKIEAGMLEIKNGVVNIKNLIQEIEQIFKIKTKKKGIELIFNIEENIPELLIFDELRIRQILLNLVDNSVKFTEKGYIKTIVKTLSEGENKIGLVIRVEDSGIGIPLQNIDTIFEPFMQYEGLDTKKFGGTGLGLSICKKLITAMGGDINVTSVLGRGTTFEIILNNIPLAGYDNTIAIEKDPFESDKIFFEEALILVVDDIESNRDLVKAILLKVGFKVMTAENGKEALDLIYEKQPDFIFMDIRMPVLNGIETIVKIRENHDKKSLPVFALTVFSSESISLSLNGFNGFLTKPFKLSEMLSILSRFFKFSISPIQEPTVHNFENIDFGKIKEPYELMKFLNNDTLETCRYLKNVMIISKVKSFGQQIKILAEKHKIQFLGKYGSDLVVYADNFDTVKIEEELDRLIKKINYLHKAWGEFNGK